MGLDIHAHFEIKVKGKWLHYSQPDIYRNYSLFDKMAMVVGDDENGIEAKGLPNDMTETTKLCSDVDKPDSQYHSWMSSLEIIDLNKVFRLRHEDFGFLFGNSWWGFRKYRDNYPKEVEDFRLIFWFK